MKKQTSGEGGMPLETNQEIAAATVQEGSVAQAGMQVSEVRMDAQEPGAPVQDKTGDRPEFRVVQPEVDKDGKIVYKDVGAIWKNVSKAGNEFYTMKIGKLRLLIFKNRAIGE